MSLVSWIAAIFMSFSFSHRFSSVYLFFIPLQFSCRISDRSSLVGCFLWIYSVDKWVVD